ncbi:MAG: hypothetical protein ACRECP_11750 [Methylocella sp.]
MPERGAGWREQVKSMAKSPRRNHGPAFKPPCDGTGVALAAITGGKAPEGRMP